MIQELWDLPEREYQYIALHFLGRQARHFREKDIALLESLVVYKSWWDTVDDLASNWIGAYFLKYPGEAIPYTERWIQSDNIWLQRSALLFQLKYKYKTDWKLLTAYILQCADQQQFFIRKAIGWALRQYAKTNSSAVIQFVHNNLDKLSQLSISEALKHQKDNQLNP